MVHEPLFPICLSAAGGKGCARPVHGTDGLSSGLRVFSTAPLKTITRMSRELGFPLFYAASPGEEMGRAALLAQPEVPQLSTAEPRTWVFMCLCA